ncbi:MAG: toxin-antitoxin system YwqK family antitoxin [Flavobacteriales bacterium]
MKTKWITTMCLCVLVACNNTPSERPELVAENKSYSITGALEKVDSTYADGSHRVSTFIDTTSKQKVAYIKFYDDGQRYTDLRYEHNQLNGECTSYYPNGTQWSMNSYRNDTLHGPYKTWHENGKPYYESHYINGEQHGECFTYYPSGKLDTRGFYTHGAKSGVWTTYNMEGKLMREIDYDKKSK